MANCFYNNEERREKWSFDEIKELSKQMNDPVVHAIIYHDHETLHEYLKLGNINVNEQKYRVTFFNNTITTISTIFPPTFAKYKLYVDRLYSQLNLIDIAFVQSGVYQKGNAGVLYYLIRYGGNLQYDHLQGILYCKSDLFKQLLLYGSLTYKNVLQIRQILYPKYPFSSRSKDIDANFADIFNVAENWHIYMILYCLSFKIPQLIWF